MNTPIQKAADRYGKDLGGLIHHYLIHGMVISDDKVFAMLVLHNKDILTGKKTEKELDKLDCWYVHYAAGDLKRLFKLLPYEAEWAAFERGDDKPLKFYNLQRLRRLIHGRKRR